MQYDDPLDKARAYGVSAAQSLAAHGLAPTPSAYCVWYTFHGGHCQEVVGAIGKAIAKGEAITDGMCADLFNRYLAPEGERSALDNTGAALQAAVDTVLGLLREAGQDASAFSASLTDTEPALTAATPMEALRTKIRALADRTAGMVRRNRDLQSRLEESNHEVQGMRNSLNSLRQEAQTDALTGVANRRRFDAVLRNEAARTAGEDLPLCLVLADIDHFKSFNDRFGHPVGDQVLKSVSQMLAAGVRGGDLVARFGGEEFAIIMPAAALEAAIGIADRLRANIASRKIVQRGSSADLGNVTLSFGVAAYRVGEPLAGLIARADKALYAAKHGGRNRVQRELDEPVGHA